LYLPNENSAQNLLKDYSSKNMKFLNKRSLRMLLMILRHRHSWQGSVRPWTVFTAECDLVGDLVFRQEGASQTHQSVLEISKINEICLSSVVRITYDLFRATHSKENNVPVRLLMYSWMI